MAWRVLVIVVVGVVILTVVSDLLHLMAVGVSHVERGGGDTSDRARYGLRSLSVSTKHLVPSGASGEVLTSTLSPERREEGHKVGCYLTRKNY